MELFSAVLPQRIFLISVHDLIFELRYLFLWISLAIYGLIGQKKLVAKFLFAVLFPRSSCVIWFSLSWSCISTVKRVVVESFAVCFFKALWSCYSGLFFSEDLDQSIHLIFDLQFVTCRRGGAVSKRRLISRSIML